MNEHIKEVCKIGQGHACCRYLLMGPDGWECAKLDTEKGISTLEETINNTAQPGRTAKDILDIRAASGQMTARGDNCEGKTIEFLNA